MSYPNFRMGDNPLGMLPRGRQPDIRYSEDGVLLYATKAAQLSLGSHFACQVRAYRYDAHRRFRPTGTACVGGNRCSSSNLVRLLVLGIYPAGTAKSGGSKAHCVVDVAVSTCAGHVLAVETSASRCVMGARPLPMDIIFVVQLGLTFARAAHDLKSSSACIERRRSFSSVVLDHHRVPMPVRASPSLQS